jgi:hypothetical protein
VAVAIALLVLCAWLDVRLRPHLTVEDERTAARITRAASTVILVLLVVFFVVGDRIDWQVLLPGLAWRAWLFVYALPAVMSALGSGRA